MRRGNIFKKAVAFLNNLIIIYMYRKHEKQFVVSGNEVVTFEHCISILLTVIITTKLFKVKRITKGLIINSNIESSYSQNLSGYC
jgi:hypothetical protein